MYFDVLSLLLGGVGLSQGSSSSRTQAQILDKLAAISAAVVDSEGIARFIPDHVWENWKETIHDHTVFVVTGCHEYAEAFDRPCAYALKFALDRLGGARGLEPLHSIVVGDIWFEKTENGLSERPFILSVGGPAINEVSRRIASEGRLARREGKWVVFRHQDRLAIFGEDPKDTLSATRGFAESQLEGFANGIW